MCLITVHNTNIRNYFCIYIFIAKDGPKIDISIRYQSLKFKIVIKNVYTCIHIKDMILTVNKWGNSQGVRFPKALLDKIHTAVGMNIKAEYRDGKIIIEAVDALKKYSINDLVKKIPVNFKQIEYNWGVEGKEIW